MSRRIIYIINPISGTRKKKDLQAFIERRTAEMNIPFQVFPSVASGDYSFLHSIIKEQQVTDVVIAGGDGTVSQVIGSLMHCGVNFGIIPCGSGNGLALAAHIPKQPAKALELIFSGKPVPTDGFMINNHFSCMLCGLGFDAKVAHDFANQSRRGLATYVKEVVRNFFSAKTYRFSILHDGNQLVAEAFFISIANSNQFGNNVTIAPAASLSDGLLDIVVVMKQGKTGLLLQLIKQLRGKNKPVTGTIDIGKKRILYFQAVQLVIKNVSQAPLHIDGDPAETPDEVQVKVMKECFRLIQPA
ncbi:MAG: diacylglycerol kinase [Chitinophagaceae bacterium]|nr:diacylglycerol kinase [Chitinophagaceae bacterium]